MYAWIVVYLMTVLEIGIRCEVLTWWPHSQDPVPPNMTGTPHPQIRHGRAWQAPIL